MDQSRTLYHILKKRASENPQGPALLAPGRPQCSCQQLVEFIETTALLLNRLGFSRGQRIALVIPNGPEMAGAYLAVGAVCTCAPLNPAYTEDEFAFYLKDLGASGLVLPAGSASPARSAAARINLPVIEIETDPSQPAGLFQIKSGLQERDVSSPVMAELDEQVLVLHTSGTTSRPKIVPITQRNLAHSVANIISTYDLGRADRSLNVMPLFHIHGLVGVLSASLAAGGSVVCTPGFDLMRFFEWLDEFHPSWYSAVPTTHQAIVEVAGQQNEIIERAPLRFIRSASSALPAATASRLEELFKTPVVEAYGMTEATHQIASNPLPPGKRKNGSVGLAAGCCKVAILDEAGSLQPAGRNGEICIRGENVMGGYEANPEANAASFCDGWLRTGDLGVIDEDGYVYIQGRSKEMINRGGEKISPREVDEALLQHPAIQQAVAFAVPHSTLGEDVAAAVVLRSGFTADRKEIRQFVSKQLAEFKVPRQVLFLNEIPKGATGKVQRIGLADRLRNELDAARGQADEITPATQLQTELLEMWQELLMIPSIGIHDDFIALGGDSIRALRLLAQINAKYAIRLTVIDLFDRATVSEISALVEEKMQAGV